MDALLTFLKMYAHDSSGKTPPRSTLPATFLFTFIIFLLIEVPGMWSMNELGIMEGWIRYRLETTHLIVSLVAYALLFVLIRILLLLLQHLPDLYKKAKEEDERIKLEDDQY